MSERNIISSTTAIFLSEILEFLAPLKWFALLAIILIIVDLKFGISAARVRGEKIRTSRALRRSINKAVDYICWILLAGVLDKAFGIPFNFPLLPALVLLVVFGCEVNSCYCNYFESKGKNIKVDFFSIFRKKMDIIEIKEVNNENKS